ncbi:hypothetical protein [Ruminococcus sp.]|uniref:hypothetical protein n=1 Tax=Ruminococcus sp. TaxID=41978 RepID=UPI0025F60D56|nr:hypothetical protein [Ruminococcus sp.]MBQ8965697.1 hypothetical protein [Ruminococcus sp.]
MKAHAGALALLILIFAAVWAFRSSCEMISQAGRYKTTAHVEGVVQPEKKVFGTFTDSEGRVRSGELFLNGMLFPAAAGDDVAVVYDSKTDSVHNYRSIVLNFVCSWVSVLAFGAAALILKRKKGRACDTEKHKGRL